MERRIFIAIVVSLALLWGWAALAPKLFPELVMKQPAATSTTAPTSTAATATHATSSTTPNAPAAAPSIAAGAPRAAVAPVSGERVQITTVETNEYIAQFSNRGAQLTSFKLKRFSEDDGSPVDLVKARPAQSIDYPMAIQAGNPQVHQVLNSALYALTDRTERGVRVLEYRYAGADGISATKTFRLPDDYQFSFEIAVQPPTPYRVVVGPGIHQLSDAELKDTQVIITGHGVVQQEGDFEVIPREKGAGLRVFPGAEFVGIEDNYFLSVLRPKVSGGEALLRRVEVQHGTTKRKDFYAGVSANPSGVVSGDAFFGPKEATVLDRHNLGKAAQFGWFGIIARFFLGALRWLNTYTHNYGFAIIVLTILIKIALYPLQHKSIVSMRKMQKLQPKVEKIKAKYKKAKSDPDQRQQMNVEMMGLYQKEGINPMAGCFPILLQLPILWGFYGLLSRAIELRNAPFILWIHDLSEKDPYYITPLLMTITWLVQTWITPSTGDPMQRRIFMIMPLFFGFLFKDFPSGLVLYWLMQNILTIIQQSIMNRWWKTHPDTTEDEK